LVDLSADEVEGGGEVGVDGGGGGREAFSCQGDEDGGRGQDFEVDLLADFGWEIEEAEGLRWHCCEFRLVLGL